MIEIFIAIGLLLVYLFLGTGVVKIIDNTYGELYITKNIEAFMPTVILWLCGIFILLVILSKSIYDVLP